MLLENGLRRQSEGAQDFVAVQYVEITNNANEGGSICDYSGLFSLQAPRYSSEHS